MNSSPMLPHLLKQLNLSSMQSHWQIAAEEAAQQGWLHERFLAHLCEQEVAYRQQRRVERLLKESHLPPGKTLSSFRFDMTTTVNAPLVQQLAQQSTWVNQAENVLLFGASGVGKTHLASAIAHGLIEQGIPVLSLSATLLVQKLQQAKRELLLENALLKLDKYRLLILDDIGYVKKNEQETSVLFELISHRYESGSLLITSNQPFSQWESIFTDISMTTAAIDRLIHHSTIIEISGESYRKQTALERGKTITTS